ncbi:unnamed protein product [Tetraodon nigroviridis]|uniref:(spotted green pufferfish) hypothetical protein n=1 Tax=Tetraodon nigroviridis TaxID=99883 RepID=Q4RLZ6_TETNG|nr:unnamed protein product [Tetraodon nigroviridis]
MFSSGQEEHCAPSKEPVKYGELVVLGYNGSLPNGDRGRRKSRFALYRRTKANGVKPSTVHIINTPQASKAVNSKGQHSISYTLSRNHTVVVEYSHDDDTDMFQIGRSTESPIDFVVTDTVAGGQEGEESPITQSTISRFACRVVCERSPPYTARIYAAGFDSSKNIFLGEKAAKWKNPDGHMDGLTTNGVLVMHPRGGFTEESKPGVWREISVCGDVYTLRETRSAQTPGKLVSAPPPPTSTLRWLGTLTHREPPLPAGGEREQRAAGRVPGGPLRGHPAVAHQRGPLPRAHPEAPGSPQAGDQRGAAPVPRGAQHAGLPQHAAQPRPLLPAGQAALGLPGLRPRARLSQLGQPLGAGAQRPARVPHVPGGRALRAALAGLRGRLLRGHGRAHARLRAVRTRVLGEVCEVLVGDTSAPRHPRLPLRLPLLRHPAQSDAGLR